MTVQIPIRRAPWFAPEAHEARPADCDIEDLGREQAASLVRFIDTYGYRWKSHLYKFWQGRPLRPPIPAEDAPILEQIRKLLRPRIIESIYAREVALLRIRAGL